MTHLKPPPAFVMFPNGMVWDWCAGVLVVPAAAALVIMVHSTC